MARQKNRRSSAKRKPVKKKSVKKTPVKKSPVKRKPAKRKSDKKSPVKKKSVKKTPVRRNYIFSSKNYRSPIKRSFPFTSLYRRPNLVRQVDLSLNRGNIRSPRQSFLSTPVSRRLPTPFPVLRTTNRTPIYNPETDSGDGHIGILDDPNGIPPTRNSPRRPPGVVSFSLLKPGPGTQPHPFVAVSDRYLQMNLSQLKRLAQFVNSQIRHSNNIDELRRGIAEEKELTRNYFKNRDGLLQQPISILDNSPQFTARPDYSNYDIWDLNQMREMLGLNWDMRSNIEDVRAEFRNDEFFGKSRKELFEQFGITKNNTFWYLGTEDLAFYLHGVSTIDYRGYYSLVQNHYLKTRRLYRFLEPLTDEYTLMEAYCIESYRDSSFINNVDMTEIAAKLLVTRVEYGKQLWLNITKPPKSVYEKEYFPN